MSEGRRPAAIGPGDPRSYRDVQRQQLLVLISEGMTKVKACQLVGVPPHVVSGWVASDPMFRSSWLAARVEQAHAMADEAIDIADEECVDQIAVMRARNRIEVRKWFSSKAAPGEYGQHVKVDHTHVHGVVLLPALNVEDVQQIRLSEGAAGEKGEVLSEWKDKDDE